MKKDARTHSRVRIPEDRLLPCEATTGELKGQVSVLGTGGAFIRTHDSHPVGKKLALRIQGIDEVLETQAVVRDVVPGGVGIAFTRLGSKQKQNLKKILARVRE